MSLTVRCLLPWDIPLRTCTDVYFLEGMPAPDHATIARFISLHFSRCSKELLAQLTGLLYTLGEISGKTIFIDGIKIESAANKYTFVWRKTVTKNQSRLFEKITAFGLVLGWPAWITQIALRSALSSSPSGAFPD